MKNLTKRSLALVLVLIVCLSCLPIFHASATSSVDYVYNGKYLYNWGERGEDATFLSPNALDFYTGNNTYSVLSQKQGSSSTSSVASSALYTALQSLMKSKHTHITSYGETRDLYQYTDCENSGGKISSFYSGKLIGPSWDSGKTWNREHTWPNSKGLGGSDENDIMMLRPTSVSENSSRGNTAYGQSSSYYHPNSESGGDYDLRGDVARIFLYVYVRWGNTSYAWGKSGVMESVDVLLDWMEQDPVDTWELGRNDAVEAITGTRNVFVDYPEFAFLLFNESIPSDMTTPSGGKSSGGSTTTTTTTAPTTTEPTPVLPPVTPSDPNSTLLTTESITPYRQIKDQGTTQALRVLFVANQQYLYSFEKLTLTITFSLTDGSTKTYVGILGKGSDDFTLFQSVTALGEPYHADAGCLIFGVAITNIPKTTVKSATVILTDPTGLPISQGKVTLS